MKHHRLIGLISLGLVHCMTAPGTLGAGSSAGAWSDLATLVRDAGVWAWQAITEVEYHRPNTPDKLHAAAADFGATLCKVVDSLEARAGVLGGLLNGPDLDAVEHVALMRAVEVGGDLLAPYLRAAVQRVFDLKRLAGLI